ncbi:MAG: class IV adenylate cyclase [Tepidisphaeraceae bacterium]
MPRNVEIKAHVDDLEQMRQRAAAIADRPPQTLRQEDVFFAVPRGRLKLRTQNGAAELIYYFRENSTEPRPSTYLRIPIPDPATTQAMLALVHGERGIVRKTRWLYLSGQTRIHLDRVENLGDFLELEVVLRDDQSADEGKAIARDLMARLQIRDDQLLDRAYIDLDTPP